MRLTSSLINGNSSSLNNDNSRVLQKLIKYFNCRIISTSFALPSPGVFPVIFILQSITKNLRLTQVFM